MNGAHPWLDWLKVLVIFAAGLVVVMVLVRALISWAHRDETKNGPKGGPDRDPDKPIPPGDR